MCHTQIEQSEGKEGMIVSMKIVTSIAIGILGMIIILVFIKKDVLNDIGSFLNVFPKYAKIILSIVCIGLLIFLIVFEIMHFLK